MIIVIQSKDRDSFVSQVNSALLMDYTISGDLQIKDNEYALMMLAPKKKPDKMWIPNTFPFEIPADKHKRWNRLAIFAACERGDMTDEQKRIVKKQMKQHKGQNYGHSITDGKCVNCGSDASLLDNDMYVDWASKICRPPSMDTEFNDILCARFSSMDRFYLALAEFARKYRGRLTQPIAFKLQDHMTKHRNRQFGHDLSHGSHCCNCGMSDISCYRLPRWADVICKSVR